MQTGRALYTSNGNQEHVNAIVVAATAVFTHELCRNIFAGQQRTSAVNIKRVARVCACNLMQSAKCKELEAIVEAVMEAPDGLPTLSNTPVLAEVMQLYHESISADDPQAFCQNTLVPAIVETAIEEGVCNEDTVASIACNMNDYEREWELFVPSTPFQTIVCSAISNMGI